MDQTTTATEQKLLSVLTQFKRLGWHQRVIAGCKPSEIRVLFCVKEGTSAGLPDIKVSEISKHLGVTSPTITQLLKGLETQGLIERNIDTVDRRAVGIKLTHKGEMVAQQAGEAFLATMKGLVQYLGEEQSDQLAELLSQVVRYFGERDACIAGQELGPTQDTVPTMEGSDLEQVSMLGEQVHEA
jgi:DNA-binding MarR family transcriptional regulator